MSHTTVSASISPRPRHPSSLFSIVRTALQVLAVIAILLAVIGTIFIPLTTYAATPPTLAFQDTTLNVGEEGQLDLVLDEVPTGLAGYHIVITLSDPTVAQIIGVQFPPSFELHATILSSSTEIQIKAIDLDNLDVVSGDTNVKLATLEVSGISEGTTFVEVSLGQLRIDDDNGDPISPQFSPAVLTVVSQPPPANPVNFPTLSGLTSPVRDNDGDGLAEDINGNGGSDFADITIFFQGMTSPEVTDNADLFDFNQNSSLDFGDVVTLFTNMAG